MKGSKKLLTRDSSLHDISNMLQFVLNLSFAAIFSHLILFSLAKPRLQQSSRQVVNVAIGNRALLVCTVSGYPQPNVTWSKKDTATNQYTAIDVGNTKKYQMDQIQGYLTINDIQQEDQGDYECLAANMYGTANGTYEVIVRRKSILYIICLMNKLLILEKNHIILNFAISDSF